jgi:microcystin-dependent protein
MPNVRFSQLPLATSVDGDDIFTLVQQPELINKIVTYQTLVSQITALTPAQQTSFVRLSGGTMTGYLTLNANPVANLHAATKQYVDEVAVDSPIGTVMYFAASSAPVGWFECDGRNLDTQSFPDLFAAIRYTYGGSGVNFRLPDLRGEFLRGWDRSSVVGARGVDPGRVFGSSQGDEFRSHSHQSPTWNGSPGTYEVPSGTLYGYDYGVQSAPTAATGGTETRPRNVALLPCIKYSSTAQVSQVGLSAQELINYITSLGAQIAVLAGQITVLNAQIPPIGTIAWFSSDPPPPASYWLVCDGRNLSTTANPQLFAVIGYQYGNPGGGFYTIPDLRGEFIRGMDKGRGIDPTPNRLPGNVQTDAFRSHTHTATQRGDDGFGSGAGYAVVGFNANIGAGDASLANTGGAETRPRNVALLPFIRIA